MPMALFESHQFLERVPLSVSGPVFVTVKDKTQRQQFFFSVFWQHPFEPKKSLLECPAG